ncbi:PREDICTED: histone-lysine N-methyltransferase ash1 [Dinoponera quadriceps]|uniref:Histone-lysine N-methyltransferase ash1 n=1 Tax=Dinoponera quadriceps TaxID=609295 RepID=A0A6P3XP75_DINQU|nr:PREDICTED: histone-lysine N-methyltransferase ash1 [Dinoponera quadriceps]XP_014480310.1 PREDICTED: histone-lysine N-methyltransferase ash1 [Dinoponera quadriceps]XP_014480311.1 PREDICTED: histone-lysine N-methyltransferase ash1 [Dinoponera quadriceps]
MSGDSGWSSVIQHASEIGLQTWNWAENDGEQERELPSTVDMDAIKGGGSWDPATEPNGTDSADSEEDSDSDDESSGGTEDSCSYSDSNSESDDESSGDEEEGDDSGSNSDCSSDHSEQTFSIQETNFEQGALKLKITMKGPKKEESEKIKCEKGRRNVSKRLKTNHGNKSSECSSEDSDSSTGRMPSQQQQQLQQYHALQEINQEDLAAILPAQEQEDAPFDGFEDSESGRLVSKAIERMSLGADSDTSENGDQNPVPVYSSALLQQFVEKTALLSEPRKRRSKLGKKLNDNEYPCVSNVSPDSGIQSVDNSPLHLAISPVSPLAQTQSPIQPPVVTKPAVNVDRVLYPPKRKPGRPAKTLTAMQPRGPGRPRLRPEIVEKKEAVATTVRKRGKALPYKSSTQASRERKEENAPSKRSMKGKSMYQKKRYGAKLSQEKTQGMMKKATTNVPMRVKCLSRSTASKLLPQCDGRTCRKVRQDRTVAPNSKSTTPLTRQKQTSCEQAVSSAGKRSSKENRNNASRKQNLAKKVAPPTNTRRVLKENKCNKKSTGPASGFSEINVGVGVQTLISVPVSDMLKAEQATNAKCDKATQPVQHNNYCHKHHHHKHRRRMLAPPKNPIRVNPCIIQEMEKLIEEFARSCSLGRNNVGTNHSELPHIFRVKKLTKKRKGGDVSVGDEQKLMKRRLKKEKVFAGADSKNSANTSTSSNPNEQRLPLKKRHYHVSSPHSSQSSNANNSTESHIEEAIEATITRYGGSSASSVHEEAVPVTPKKRLRDADGVTSNKQGGSDEDKSAAQSEVQPRRKKKIVKDLRVTVTKLPAEGHSGAAIFDKSAEKSSKTTVEKSSKSEKTTSIKSADVEHVRAEKSIKVDSELQVSEALDDTETVGESKAACVGNASVPNLMNNTAAAMMLTKKKIRRRKAINRTGFPTLKKRKKKKETGDSSTAANSGINSKMMTLVRALCKVQGIERRFVIAEDTKLSLIDVDDRDVLAGNNEEEKGHVARDDVKNFDNSSTAQETSSRSGSDEVTETCAGQLRVRKDLVESDSSVLSDKLYPVKFEKLQDCRVYDENVSLEETLERYNQSQRIAELSEENLRKLERANAQTAGVKMELSGCFNNNHKRRRGSASPSNLCLRKTKRLRSGGYDTESEAPPSSDVASEDQEVRKSVGVVHNRKNRCSKSRWKNQFFEPSCLLPDYNSKGRDCFMQHCDASHNVYHNCGKLLRQRKIQGQLQYEQIQWLENKQRSLSQPQQKSQKKVPSWNYKKIRTNIYYDVKPTTLYEAQACECKPESGCGDDCINRMVFSECSPQLCPCNEKCKNQKIQKHEWSPGLLRFMTKDKGLGVKTQHAIKSGNFILEYVGEVVSEREFKSRMATRYASDTHHYCLHLDGGLVIDGHRMGGDGRFVNHSCEPNCEMQKWSVHGLPRMALFASRDIKPGEELTYDYNFALFNPSEGQQCRCGSSACRGVIGGKSQRVARSIPALPAQAETTERRTVGRPRKNVRKSNTVQSANSKSLCKSRKMGDTTLTHAPQLRPMSYQQRCFAREHHCFLLRNLEKVRRLKSSVQQMQVQNGKTRFSNVSAMKEKGAGDSKAQSDAFFSQLTALTNTNARTVRTRRLAQAQDDPEVHKTAKLAKVLKDLYTIVATANDENGQLLCTPFMTLPSKRKLPDYYEKVTEPIDLSMIDQCIGTGHYKTAEHFDHDMIRLFDNNVRFFGRTSEIGIAAARLRKLYLGSKPDFVNAITEAMGSPPSQGFLPPRGSTAGEEDVIRCICGLHRDEGLMIQCERCLVWQHCDCVKADTSIESYLCERCQPREVDLEIPLEVEVSMDCDDEEKGKKHYVTLLRGDLQLRQGDTVYVLRDTPEKHTYKTIQKPDYEQMDIFRIERLWKNAAGERFVFGHHYLRPHETYHEPSRKFYVNEVVCAPLYEAVPCDLVAERCWVLDPHTFCKGRPVGSTPEHTYVCEYRVDRAARLFTKVSRARHQVCTKPYAFETFPQRIKHYRTYLPHSLDGIQLGKKFLLSKDKKKNNNNHEDGNQKMESGDNAKPHKEHKCAGSNRTRQKSGCDILTIASSSTTYLQREDQKKRLNSILLHLLQKMPNKKDPLDLSFLLERNRRNRKRPGGLNP